MSGDNDIDGYAPQCSLTNPRRLASPLDDLPAGIDALRPVRPVRSSTIASTGRWVPEAAEPCVRIAIAIRASAGGSTPAGHRHRRKSARGRLHGRRGRRP